MKVLQIQELNCRRAQCTEVDLMYSRVAIAFSVLSPIFEAFTSSHLCQRSLRSETTAEDLGRILISNQSTDHLPLG